MSTFGFKQNEDLYEFLLFQVWGLKTFLSGKKSFWRKFTTCQKKHQTSR